jgi:hypothetical protein
MAAADLFDDVADADPGSESESAGVVLTAAAGLLGLAGAAVVRVVDDGGSPTTAVALAHLLGVEFAHAANGQALSLEPSQQVDALTAYQHAAAKSGPLGSLLTRLGARTVPLVFTGSQGAPDGLAGAALETWELQERARIAAGGGLAAAVALAEAERLGAAQALDALEQLGCPVAGLRDLIQ